jgi:para-nitrobenzyl esterase
MITSLLTSPDLATAEDTGRSFATTMGCTDQSARCLRSLSVRDILTRGLAFTSQARVIVDGTVLPRTLGAALSSGQFNRVPLIAGTNRDEHTWFVALTELATGHVLTAAEYRDAIEAAFGPNAPAVLARYPLRNYSSPSLALAAVQTDSRVSCPSRRLIQWVSRVVPRTFAYEFADRTAPQYTPPVSFPYLAAHTSEIQYLFPLYHGATGTIHPLNAAQQRLSDQMVTYWTRFARSGWVNGPQPPYSPPFWPRYTEQRDNFQSLRLPEPVTTRGAFAAEHQCAFWNRVLGLDRLDQLKPAAAQ